MERTLIVLLIVGTAWFSSLPTNADSAPVSQAESSSPRIDGVFVGAQPNAQFSRKPDNIIELTTGDLLVSVRAPAHAATIITPVGNVSVAADCDAVIGFYQRTIRIQNLHGTADGVTAKLEKTYFDDGVNEVTPIPQGRELLAVAKAHNSAPLPGSITSEDSLKAAQQAANDHRQRVGVGFVDVALTGAAGLASTAYLVNTISQAQKNQEETAFLKELRTSASLTPYWNPKWDQQQATPSADATQATQANIESAIKALPNDHVTLTSPPPITDGMDIPGVTPDKTVTENELHDVHGTEAGHAAAEAAGQAATEAAGHAMEDAAGAAAGAMGGE